MLDELRDRMAAFLSAHPTCTLATSGPDGAWAAPVRCRNRGLEVECLLPQWADAVYHLEHDPRVLLILQDAGVDTLRWMELRGTARRVAAPDWGGWPIAERRENPRGDLYRVIRVTPARIDLIDEAKGWGARETLEL